MFGTGDGGVFAGIAMMAMGLIVIILTVLACAMPWFVWKIRQRAEDVERHTRETNRLLSAILENRDKPERARSIFKEG